VQLLLVLIMYCLLLPYMTLQALLRLLCFASFVAAELCICCNCHTAIYMH
jgi:hypothetical protein